MPCRPLLLLLLLLQLVLAVPFQVHRDAALVSPVVSATNSNGPTTRRQHRYHYPNPHHHRNHHNYHNRNHYYDAINTTTNNIKEEIAITTTRAPTMVLHPSTKFDNVKVDKLTLVEDGQIDRNVHQNNGLHRSGRHICSSNKNVSHPVKMKQAFCIPTYKKYYVPCGNARCTAVRLVYETHFKDILTTKNVNEVSYSCCPGWTRSNNRSHGCNKAICTKPCVNGGKCVRPDTCGCPKGFAGYQCEIKLNLQCSKECLNGGKCVGNNVCKCLKGFAGDQCEFDQTKPFCGSGCLNGGICIRHGICKCLRGYMGEMCEKDVDECKEFKPCDQKCINIPGSFICQCKEDFVLQPDGQSCRKENIDGSTLEAKDLEYDMLDKRLLKLETMMDESHKNDVSKDDLKKVFADMDILAQDINELKGKLSVMESTKNEINNFHMKLHHIEKKTTLIDDLLVKYDRIKKCLFYHKC